VKLAVLSRAPQSYSTQRFRAAAVQRGHQIRVLNTLRFAIDLTADEPDLQYRGRQLSDYDAILPRIGNSITYFGTAVVRQFEQMDVYTPNTANGISSARDKLRANQILSRHNIAMPPTAFVRNRADVRPAIERVGGAPVVIKLLEGEDGPLVMEVNSSPGLQGIETATGLDVAGAIIDHIANQVNFPEIDVRQRLSVSTGYGVAELVIHAGAEQVGKKLGDLGLWDRDITVLTLHRGVTVIPNPRKHVVLQDEDRLLCFGKLDEMRSMIPERRRRRAKVRKLPKEHLPDPAA